MKVTVKLLIDYYILFNYLVGVFDGYDSRSDQCWSSTFINSSLSSAIVLWDQQFR